MSSYIGKVQIGSGDQILIGSTLYGICTTAAGTAAKTVTTTDNNSGKFINNSYDNLIQGTTIHVKFTQGNTATSGLTLAVGSTLAKSIVGNCTCPAGTIISFTLDENENWVANDNVDTNTEYVFKTAYNATTNKALTESDIGAAAPKGVVTDLTNNTSSTDLPTAAAVASYVSSLTGGLAGLTGAMHFRGIATQAVTDGGTENPTITNYDFGTNGVNAVAGDVVLYNGKEFVWTGSVWELLGDEGSYALKSSTDTITEVASFTANTLPQLTITPTSIPNVTNAGSVPSLTVTPVTIPNVTDVGSRAEASVTAGVLTITLGAAPTLGTAISVGSASNWNAGSIPTLGTAISVGSASGWNAGSQAALSTNNTEVVVPVAPSTP